jgi:phosphatidylglycerol:prolipoprotein diacylglycerol transferase
MLAYPSIDPVAFHLGSWPVYWYGLMYLFGLLIAWVLMSFRARHSGQFTLEQVSDILFFSALGIILGGRLGYMIFYDWPLLWSEPLTIFQTWKGGMSFHGGLLGVILALGWFSRKLKRSIFELTDFVAPVVPIGLGLGRIGNFINGELWGRVTTVSWGMIFPSGGPLPRHPSQLYESFFEGFVLFLILWFYSRRPRPLGAVSGLFLLGYGLFRFGLEFFREPDVQIGFLWDNFTEGQLLSLPMILLGVMMLLWATKRKRGIAS